MAAAIVLGALLLIAGVLAFGYFNGWFTKTGVEQGSAAAADGGEEITFTVFSDAVTRDVLIRSVQSEALYLCGNYMVSSADAITYDGGWCVLGKPVENGGVEDASLFQGNKALTQLAAVDQNISDVSGFSDMTKLTYLDISGNPIEDLSGLDGLKNLEILGIRHIAAKDLSVLNELPKLKRVIVSAEMFELVRPYLGADYDVIVKE